MRSEVIHEGTQRTYALVFDKGDEVVATIQRFATEHGLFASQLTGLGAFEDVVLADGKPKLHAHVVVGRADASTRGG